MRLVIWLLCLLLFLSPPAQANSTCSASLSNINFAVVNPFGGNVDVAGTVSFSCSKSVLDLLSTDVRVCIDIGDGSMGSGSINPRRMGTGGGSYLNFNLYSDAARSIIWGHPSHAFAEVTTSRNYGLLGNSFTDSIQIYGRVFSGQTSTLPGSYSNLFSGVHARIRWADAIGVPANCNEGSASFSFSALATVQAQCSVTATDLDFGNQGLLQSLADASSSIFVTCTSTTPYQVGLNDGMHENAGSRRMENAGQFVSYGLFRDASRSLAWGDTLSVDTAAGTGTGAQQTLTVYGRVPVQTPRPAGTYSDTITVTITY